MRNVAGDIQKDKRKLGLLYSFMAYGLWGILPLYWKLIHGVPAYEILAHRIVWSYVFVSVLLTLGRKWESFVQVWKNPKSILFLALSSLLIGVNWFVYIWAVNAGHILETSMGYYINPLVSILLGTLVLKEKLDRWQKVAIGLAVIGVAAMAIRYGSIPWISLVLAVSFALYGLCKKMISVESSVGLALETLVLVPFSAAFLIWEQVQGTGALGHSSLLATVLLLCAGAVTATPLLWFAKGAQRLDLTTLGFVQYVSPTLSLLLGVLVFHEKFTLAHWLGFGCIWCALAVYSISRMMMAGKSERSDLLSRSA